MEQQKFNLNLQKVVKVIKVEKVGVRVHFIQSRAKAVKQSFSRHCPVFLIFFFLYFSPSVGQTRGAPSSVSGSSLPEPSSSGASVSFTHGRGGGIGWL